MLKIGWPEPSHLRRVQNFPPPNRLVGRPAWNTGHPGGVATVHANSAAAALTRLEQLIAERVRDVPLELIADAVDLVVFMKRDIRGRCVDEILRVDGLRDGGYLLATPLSPDLVIIKEGTTP